MNTTVELSDAELLGQNKIVHYLQIVHCLMSLKTKLIIGKKVHNLFITEVQFCQVQLYHVLVKVIFVF